MLKFVDTKVVFREIPNEITLAINISGCPIRCPDCHSKYLWDNIGTPLDKESIIVLIEKNLGITCLAFMGGDSDIQYLKTLFQWVKANYPDLKIAWYSGREDVIIDNIKYLDYVKTGPYIKECGPLNDPNTNQKMYEVCMVNKLSQKYILSDITYKFQKM